MNTTAELVKEIERLTQALADKDLALMEQQEIAQAANRQAEAATANERERAARLALQWSNARGPEFGGNALRAYAQALRDGVEVDECETTDFHWSKAAPQQHAQAAEIKVFDGDSTDQPVVEATAKNLLKSRQRQPAPRASQPIEAVFLAELLARIHRDGGHRQGEVGTEQAFREADAIVVKWLATEQTAPVAAAAQGDERSAFEEWAMPQSHCRVGDSYSNLHTACAWEAWQARAELSQRAASKEDREEPEHDVAVLLRLRQPLADGTPVHVVVTKRRYEALKTVEELNSHDKFLYNEHTCPTNWLGVEYIIDGEDCDPHGIFEHVQTIEIPQNEWGTGLIDFSDPNEFGHIDNLRGLFSALDPTPIAASQPDTVPTTVANQAINDALRVGMQDSERDAARWRAFVGSARIKPQGSAGLENVQADNYAHMGLEIWTTFPRDCSAELLDRIDRGTELGRKWLTAYADVAVAAMAAQQSVKG